MKLSSLSPFVFALAQTAFLPESPYPNFRKVSMSKRFAICTLFEGSYHLGVGPLVNSLYTAGFRGIIWAGYRGSLPPWATPGKAVGCYWEYSVAEDCIIRFLPLETKAHLTNYKPDFMLRILEMEAPDCDGVFYFDPDIVLSGTPWRYIEEWSECGVAVCEDVNSPFALQHPRRVGWRRFYAQHEIPLHPGESFYANGGFIGIRREQIAFLKLWKRLQDHLWEALGGANYVGIGGGKPVEDRSGFAGCFDKTDQDVLNATIEAADIPVSFANKQAMGFESGKAILPHALGASKPWNKRYLADALNGLPPRAVDKAYWQHAAGPICVFTADQLRRQKGLLAIASALGRFIRRN